MPDQAAEQTHEHTGINSGAFAASRQDLIDHPNSFDEHWRTIVCEDQALAFLLLDDAKRAVEEGEAVDHAILRTGVTFLAALRKSKEALAFETTETGDVTV